MLQAVGDAISYRSSENTPAPNEQVARMRQRTGMAFAPVAVPPESEQVKPPHDFVTPAASPGHAPAMST